MILVPLVAVASQVLRTTLGVQPCLLRVYQKTTGLYIDVLLNDRLVIGGVLCLDSVRIVRDPYLGFFGDLVFYDMHGRQDPDYTGLGDRFILVYLNPSEIAASALSTDRIPTPSTLAQIVAGGTAGKPPPPAPLIGPPMTPSAFIAMLGVNSSLNYPNTPYAQAQKVVDSLKYLNINRLRDGVPDPLQTVTFAGYTLVANAGVTFNFVVASGVPVPLTSELANIKSFMLAHPSAVTSVEGPNEINLQPITYSTFTDTYLSGVAVTKDLWASVKADPILNRLSVLSMTIAVDTVGDAAVGNLSAFVDYAADHLYAPGNDNLWSNQAVYWIPFDTQPYPGKPLIMSETGNQADNINMSNMVAAKYGLNTLFDNALNNVFRTYIYELADEPAAQGVPFMGLFDANWVAKPQAIAIHNLTTILLAGGSGVPWMKLAYSIIGLPATGYAFLLASDTTSYLAIWNDVTIWNGTTYTDIVATPVPITVNLGATFASVSVYDPVFGLAPISTFANINQLSLSLIDRPLLIAVATPAPVVITPPVTQPESAAGTSITTAGPMLYDALGHSYSLTALTQVAVDGIADPTTANASRLYYGINHQVYWQAASGLWFTRTAFASPWVGVVSPVAVESIEGATVTTVGPALYDSALNFYGINAARQMLINAAVDPTTSSVVQLYYHLHAVLYQNAAGTWFGRATPTSPWTQTVAPTAAESVDKTSVTTVGPVIYDAALNAYSLNMAGQLVTNGIAETATSGIVQLYYSAHALYTRNASNVWQTRTGPTAAFVTVPSPVLVESVEAASVTTIGPVIIDAALNSYALIAGQQISINGVADATTSTVVQLYYHNHAPFHLNTIGNWYTKITPTSAWTATTSPLPVESAEATTVTTVGPTITTSVFNVYALNFGRAVTINGVQQTGTGATAELYYHNHLVYRLDGAGAWSYQTTPTTAWIATASPFPVESAEGTSVTTVGPVLTTARFDTYGISGSQQVVFNGAIDPTTSSVTRLYYHNHLPYQENAFFNWYVNTVPPTGWVPSASPVPAAVSESAEGTVVTTVGPVITDAALNAYAITSGAQVSINGAADLTTANVIELYYHNHMIYHENATHAWYLKTAAGAVWTPTPNPFGVESAEGTLVTTVGSVLTTAALDTYGLSAVPGFVLFNGIQQAATANTLRLYYHNHVPYLENTAYQWWQRLSPTALWMQVPASPIPFTESANLTSVTTVGPAITDAVGVVYRISAGAFVVTDGVVETAISANVTQIYYANHQFYQKNASGSWYTRTSASAAYTATASPIPAPLVESAEAASVTTIGPVIIDSALNSYALTLGQQITINGTLDATTANVTRIYYHNHAPFHLNTAGNWYTKVTPSAAWTGPVTSPLPAVVGGGTGAFRVANGQIIAPDGSQWHGRGVNNVPYANYSPNSSPSVRAAFPNINFIRLVFEYIDNRSSYPLQPFYDFVADATANGVVCMLEHHEFPGIADLAGQLAWYTDIANRFKGNNNVWYATRNEPDGDYTALADEQASIINAIRGTGNNQMIMICVRGGSYLDYMSGQWGKFSGNTNIAFDMHSYGWITQNWGNSGGTPFNNAPGAFQAALDGMVGQATVYRSADGAMPVILGEFSRATSGEYSIDPATGLYTKVDDNGDTCVAVCLASPYSFTAWSLGATNPTGASALYTGDGTTTLSAWGQTVANRIRIIP